MPVSRWGVLSSWRSMPTPPFSLISDDEHVIPAAPMSCIPTTAPVWIASSDASKSSFSVKGSPTWTLGRRASESSEISSEANVAPWMPSRPVAEPTMNTGLPTPSAVALTVSPTLTMPTDIAFTSGLPW